MIVVGLVTHRTDPDVIPDLDGVASLTVRVNGQASPVPTPWLGFGANHNRLMDAISDAEWYVALNPDVEIDAADLYTLIEQAEKYGYGLVTPLLDEPWGSQDRVRRRLPTPGYFLKNTLLPGRWEIGRDALQPSIGPMQESAWIAGSCMAIHRNIRESLSFDERYFMYFEDVDLSRRARELGARVGICTKVKVNHTVGWQASDPLVGRRGVEYARSLRIYAESSGHSPLLMQMAALAHASVRAMIPRKRIGSQVASRAVVKGLVAPSSPGIAELARAHNEHYGFRQGSGVASFDELGD